jgi:hypothetical protein
MSHNRPPDNVAGDADRTEIQKRSQNAQESLAITHIAEAKSRQKVAFYASRRSDILYGRMSVIFTSVRGVIEFVKFQSEVAVR